MFIKRKFKIPMIMLLVAIFSLSTLTNAINAKGPGTGTTSNKAPVINQGDALDSTPINKGETAIITLNATDADKDVLTWSILLQPAHGKASISAVTGSKGTSKVTVKYISDSGYCGLESFKVQVMDSKLATDSIAINVQVNNRAPAITQGDPLVIPPINKDETATFTLNATDADNDTLSWLISSPAANGAASISVPSRGDTSTATVTYTPKPGYYGSDSFNVQVVDTNGATDTITINALVNNNNRAPVITQGDTLDTSPINKDETATITLNATDADNDTLSWSITSLAANGTASFLSQSSGAATAVTYTPKPGYYGSDSFNVQVVDTKGATDTITINVLVNNNNRAPAITQGDPLVIPPINKDETTTFTLNATDADNDTLSWLISSPAANGAASISVPSRGDTSTATVTYTPKPGYYGSDSFNAQVVDTKGATDTITINVLVNNNNRAPVITQGDTLDTSPINKDETATITLNATDSDNDTLLWSIISLAANGTASFLSQSSGATATVTYTPKPGYYGSDSFNVQVVDTKGATDSITINVLVNNNNRAPVITQGDKLDIPSINKDETATNTLSATDADNDTLSWSITSPAVNGTASISSPSSGDTSTSTVTYTPKPGYYGSDTFIVQVSDSSGAKDSITINVSVNNRAPVITQGDTLDINPINKGQTASITLNATDADKDNLTWKIISPPNNGTTSISQSGSVGASTAVVAYTPSPGYYGSDALKVQVSDPDGGTDIIILNIYVNKGILTIYAITDTHISTTDDTYAANKTERLRRMKSFAGFANTDKPDLVIHIGDAVQSPPDWQSFMNAWNSIAPNKLFAVGNHDFDGGDTFGTLAQRFGYTNRTSADGNQFNYSQTVTAEGVKVLVITLATNKASKGLASLDSEALNWLSNQLQTTTCPVALLVSHVAPHSTDYFDLNSSAQFNQIVKNALNSNANLKRVQSISGHEHPTKTYFDTWTYGTDFPALILKANTDAVGSFTKITIDLQNNIKWEDRIP